MIKSQDDLNQIEKHSTDVLVEALKKCQELVKENKELKIKVLNLEEEVEHWRTLYCIEVLK